MSLQVGESGGSLDLLIQSCRADLFMQGDHMLGLTAIATKSVVEASYEALLRAAAP
jgi:hypothetical protein